MTERRVIKYMDFKLRIKIKPFNSVFASDDQEHKLGRCLMYLVILRDFWICFAQTNLLPDMVEQYLILIMIVLYGFNFAAVILKSFDINTLVFALCESIYSVSFYYALIQFNNIHDEVVHRMVFVLFFCLPALLLMLKVNDYSILIEEFIRYSYLITVTGLLLFLGDTGAHWANMSFSMMMIFPYAIHFIAYCMGNKRIRHGILCILEILMIIIYGSRSTFFWGIMLLPLYIVVKYKKMKFINHLRKSIVSVGGMLIAVAITMIVIPNSFVNELTSSRTFLYLVTGKFFISPERNIIREQYIVKSNSLFRFMPIDKLNNGTNYPHNIFIEWIYEYGWILGGVFVIIFIVLAIKMMIHYRPYYSEVYMILLVSGFLMLLTSMTYLEWPLFWAFLGIILNSKRRGECFERNENYLYIK